MTVDTNESFPPDDQLTPPAEPPKSNMVREEPEGNDGRRALINDWTRRIQRARAHWDRKFKQMQRDADFARGMQWPGDVAPEDEERYVANIVQRHIQQRVASLYAKNPRFIARRKPQLDFRLWDESQDSLAAAMQAMQLGAQAAQMGLPPPPESLAAQALLEDINAGMERRRMVTRIGKTLELLMANQISEQFPPFKKQAKQLIRRTLTVSTGWVKLGYERVMQPRPEDYEKIRDLTTQLTDIERRIADAADGEDCAELETEKQELAEQIRVLQARDQDIVREGLVFDFPPPTSIILDQRCRQLQGFVGARWLAQQYDLPPDEVKRVYGVDVKSAGFTQFRPDGAERGETPPPGAGEQVADDALVRVYEVYDKTSKTTFTIAEGCPVYLREPAEPEVRLDRFWVHFPLTFNDIENEQEIYPPSDVELMRHMQLEHNRARQALREHRQANAPGYVAPRGALSDDDKELLGAQEPHSTVELDGLQPGQKVADLLQAKPQHGIDPNLYETSSIFDDVLKVNGVQEANIGGTSGATATETSVAEGARMASVASNVDDLDDFLNEIARAASQILLAEFDQATVQKIVGPGAIWPQLTAQEIADELLLEVEAGSSGKPNKAAEIKNFMDIAPILMQIPGIKPEWLAREGLRRMDDRLDLTDAFLDGLPSIQAMNRLNQMGTGNPASDPNMQGAQGADNAQVAQSAEPQPNQDPAAGAAPNPGQGMSPIG